MLISRRPWSPTRAAARAPRSHKALRSYVAPLIAGSSGSEVTFCPVRLPHWQIRKRRRSRCVSQTRRASSQPCAHSAIIQRCASSRNVAAQARRPTGGRKTDARTGPSFTDSSPLRRASAAENAEDVRVENGTATGEIGSGQDPNQNCSLKGQFEQGQAADQHVGTQPADARVKREADASQVQNTEEARKQRGFDTETEAESMPNVEEPWMWGAAKGPQEAYYATLQPGDFGAAETSYPPYGSDSYGQAGADETTEGDYSVESADGAVYQDGRQRTWFGSEGQPAWTPESAEDPSWVHRFPGDTASPPPGHFQPRGTTISPRLSKRFIESIPAGLDPAQWDANDPLAALRMLPDEDDDGPPAATAFKLELDGLTSENLVSAAGVTVTPSQVVYIVLPPYGPVVAGAQAYGACDVVIDDSRVSRRHVMFEAVRAPDGDAVYVTNTQSTNGVYRNSAPVQKWVSQRIEVGDEIALGARAVARFRLYEADATDVKDASMISQICKDLRDAGYRMGHAAWRRNARQRAALGLCTFPQSIMTEKALSMPMMRDISGSDPQQFAYEARPMAVRIPKYEYMLALLLKQRRVRYVEDFLGRMVMNYPTAPQLYLHMAQIATFYHRRYADGRKIMRASYEALQIADSHLASIARTGHTATEAVRRRFASLRVEIMVHAALNEWRANLYGPARRLFQEAQVRQSEAGLSARELLYWTWADCELEQGNVKRCLRICSQGLLHCRKRPSSLRLLEARAWYMHGNKEQAIGMLEKLAKDFPGSHAVALTHMELLHDDQPQESVSIAEQFLEATEALAKERPSTLHAAVLAEACVSYVAVGALGDALDALKNAMAVFKQLEDNAKQNAAAAKAKRAARHSSVSETVAVRPDVSGNGASSHSDVVADVAHAMAEPDIVDEKLESIMKEEAELWRRAAGPSFLCRARLRAPKLAVASAVHAAKLEDGWLKTRIAAASIALSQALIPHDARRARLLARLAVRSGKLQPEAHNAAAQAYIALRDFTRANRHVAAGFRMFPNHTGLLRTFARILREQGRMQDAVLVATYAHDVAGKGPTQVSSAVCEGFNSIRASELGV